RLINDILDLSRLEAGRIEARPARFAVPHVLDDVAIETRALLGSKRVDVKVECEADVLASDELRVRQILLNLAGNAAKFTDEGRITLTANPSNGGVVFAVEDTGLGIPDSAQAAIFEAFVQAHSGTHPGGTGLGLNIVRQLTWLLRGEVTFASRPGKGSVFRV